MAITYRDFIHPLPADIHSGVIHMGDNRDTANRFPCGIAIGEHKADDFRFFRGRTARQKGGDIGFIDNKDHGTGTCFACLAQVSLPLNAKEPGKETVESKGSEKDDAAVSNGDLQDKKNQRDACKIQKTEFDGLQELDIITPLQDILHIL